MNNVVLTGPTRGLGLAIARQLIDDKYKVIGVGRKLTKDYQLLINTSEGNACFIEYDLENLEGIPQLISTITKQHGSIYGLVNNAAIGLDGVLATMHSSDITKSLKVNLEAPILLSKFAARSMLLNKTGRIINISSIIASTGFNGLSVYAASKAGLVGFSRSLSRELGRAGITVNCVAPGFMVTDMTAALKGDKFESVRRRAPLGLAHVEDAAAAVSYLLSESGKRITGTVLTVDGGSTA